ncbi:uncharacterized protein LOC134194743 isoform X2 [Corticium candelabrum]|uniref:uncharacterized protein LOC134194743 isoform X2 n=1 Tax=Corticium candelabrum TaxID=121492 RepID=UPI002E25AE1B|nr:uncharacterized protein LOC134194743 isoform X2 [Corticium candelabrum]
MVEQEVTRKMFVKLAQNSTICADWGRLALCIDEEMFGGGGVRLIKQEHVDDPFTQVTSMLEKWHNHRAKEATLKKLIKAMCDCQWERLAEEIFEKRLVKLATQANADKSQNCAQLESDQASVTRLIPSAEQMKDSSEDEHRSTPEDSTDSPDGLPDTLRGKITEMQLFEVARAASNKWLDIGTKFCVPMQELEDIRDNFKNDKERLYEVLKIWYRRLEVPTIEAVLEVCFKAGVGGEVKRALLDS